MPLHWDQFLPVPHRRGECRRSARWQSDFSKKTHRPEDVPAGLRQLFCVDPRKTPVGGNYFWVISVGQANFLSIGCPAHKYDIGQLVDPGWKDAINDVQPDWDERWSLVAVIPERTVHFTTNLSKHTEWRSLRLWRIINFDVIFISVLKRNF